MDAEVYAAMARTQATHWWFVGRRRVLSEVLGSLQLPSGARILEVGCGPGGNLAMLKAFGRVHAVETDDGARAHARQISGLDVQPGRLPDALPFEGERFDLICLFDVLEHVEHDRDALAALRGRLAPNGRLLVTVPAYGWLYGRHDRLHHHYRRYRASQLRRVAADAGWRAQRLGYFNTLLFPLAAAKRVVERITGAALGDEAALPGDLVNRAFAAVLGFERRWVWKTFMPVGLSAIAVFA